MDQSTGRKVGEPNLTARPNLFHFLFEFFLTFAKDGNLQRLSVKALNQNCSGYPANLRNCLHSGARRTVQANGAALGCSAPTTTTTRQSFRKCSPRYPFISG